MVYKWKTGSRIKADPSKSGELFEQLESSDEGLTAQSLLNANIPEEAPLHNDYEWDNEKAAEEWRLHQSRHFINSLIMLSVMPDTEQQAQIRAFHITTEQHRYDSIQTIITSEDKYNTLLRNALSELSAFVHKYNTIQALQPVFVAIQQVTDESEN